MRSDIHDMTQQRHFGSPYYISQFLNFVAISAIEKRQITFKNIEKKQAKYSLYFIHTYMHTGTHVRVNDKLALLEKMLQESVKVFTHSGHHELKQVEVELLDTRYQYYPQGFRDCVELSWRRQRSIPH